MRSVDDHPNLLRPVLGLAMLMMAFASEIVFASQSHAAETCPISDSAVTKAGGMPEAVTLAINTEFSCEGAYRILELCQLGSSADNALSDIVRAKCEPRFLPKAIPATKAAYEKARGKCAAIAIKTSGSLGQSQAAVCNARAGRDFAAKYGTKR